MRLVDLDFGKLCIFSGSSNFALARSVSESLKLPLGSVFLGKFSDGEIRVEINSNVRGKEVFIIQSTSSPVNDNLIELLIMVNAAKRVSAKKIVVVIPYFGYARQDRGVVTGEPITAKLVADLLSKAGVDHIITVDLHSDQIQGFFDFPVDNITALPTLFKKISIILKGKDLVVVSPDIGGIKRCSYFSKKFNSDLVVINKRRVTPNKAVAVDIFGDVFNKTVLIYDDIIDTAGTIVETVKKLVENGVKEIYICCTHPVLSGPAMDRLSKLPIQGLFVTDSIDLDSIAFDHDKIVVVSIAKILAGVIREVFSG